MTLASLVVLAFMVQHSIGKSIISEFTFYGSTFWMRKDNDMLILSQRDIDSLAEVRETTGSIQSIESISDPDIANGTEKIRFQNVKTINSSDKYSMIIIDDLRNQQNIATADLMKDEAITIKPGLRNSDNVWC
ncbi:unnamed protein product [Didymodactylos carnosus]|uniref:Uncharacterized protein n=2 Tax=Didymodactylos carnosus TaxID=1234261 RepID=A0A815XKG1_9BILA|nr:unnamed protein product [Didymodactylos carnosus]CAF4419829.1 unnamed protein product [Didymodactylos carnosus]